MRDAVPRETGEIFWLQPVLVPKLHAVWPASRQSLTRGHCFLYGHLHHEPARLDVLATAKLLGFTESDIQILMAVGNCGAVWCESVPVKEVFRGETLWNGDVEVFDLTGHPKAKRAFGWSHPDGADNKTERFVAVLEIPPVDSPQTAVKMAIYSDIKNGEMVHLNKKRT